MNLPFLLAATLLTTIATSHAALTLQINHETKQMALVGSSTGTARTSGEIGSLNFRYTAPDFDMNASNATQAIGPEVGFYATGDPGVEMDFKCLTGDFDLTFRFSAGGEYTLVGTGVFIDFTGMDGSAFPWGTLPSDSFMAIQDGAVFEVVDGEGFDGGITVQIVPEPGVALLGLLGFLPLLRRRRD